MRSDAIDPVELGIPGGVATRAQWRDAGATKAMFRDGRLVRAGGNTFALPDVLTSPIEVARLVGAVAPAEAVVAGWAAALLHGVRDAGPTMQRRVGAPIQLCLARGDHRVPPGFETLRVELSPDDVQVVDGVRVTTLARTAYDMVRFNSSLPNAVAILDAFRSELNRTQLDPVELASLQAPRPRGKGHPLLRAAIPLSSTRSRSLPETRLRVRTGMALGLEPTDLAVNSVLASAESTWELDLLDRTSGLVIEYDSVHHAGTEQRDRDAQKDTDVREEGLEITRVNSVRLGRPDVELGSFLRRAQQRARRSGCASVAARLAEAGSLAERPLRVYRSAVDHAPLFAD